MIFFNVSLASPGFKFLIIERYMKVNNAAIMTSAIIRSHKSVKNCVSIAKFICTETNKMTNRINNTVFCFVGIDNVFSK